MIGLPSVGSGMEKEGGSAGFMLVLPSSSCRSDDVLVVVDGSTASPLLPLPFGSFLLELVPFLLLLSSCCFWMPLVPCLCWCIG